MFLEDCVSAKHIAIWYHSDQTFKIPNDCSSSAARSHGCNKLHHDDIQSLSTELISSQRHLIDDDLRLYNPSDQNTGEEVRQAASEGYC